MHPSGLTLARWAWPFKTDAERALVARWFAKQAKIELINSEAARW
jgi:tRNA U34 5-methylaminomethyl-2-thiouridine-forming methyltransferase MnmC